MNNANCINVCNIHRLYAKDTRSRLLSGGSYWVVRCLCGGRDKSLVHTACTPRTHAPLGDFGSHAGGTGAAAPQAAGKPVELLIGEGYNHFEIQETLGESLGLGGRAVLQQMRRTSACS